MPVALWGPHVLVQRRLKVNWKLLIWPSPAFRFGLEGNIYIHSLCFSLHSLLLFHLCLYLYLHLPPVLPLFQFTGMMWRAALFFFFTSQLFLKMISGILNTPAAVIVPSSNEWTQLCLRAGKNVIFAAPHCAPLSLSARRRWNHTGVDTMTVLPVGNSFVVQSREEETADRDKFALTFHFLCNFCSWFGMGNVQFGRNKQQFYMDGRTAGSTPVWIHYTVCS